MLKRSQIFLLLSLFLFLIIYLFLYLDLNKNLRIAHAGGKYNGKNYPNSFASIKYNLKFTKYFKLEFLKYFDRPTKNSYLASLYHYIFQLLF